MTKQVLTVIIVAVLFAVTATAHAKTACVIVSKRISPYETAYKGITSVLGNEVVRYDLDGQRERGGEVVGEVLSKGCDVIVPVGSLALDIVRLQIHDKSIVYTMVASPPAAVKVAPNVAGINIETPPSQFLKIIKQILPNVSRVGVVYNPAYAAAYVAQAEQAASRYGIELVTRTISSIKMLPNSVGDLLPRVDAILMVPDPTSSNRKAFEYLLLESTRKGIPLIGLSKKHVRDGALFSFALDYSDIGKRSGEMARKTYEGIAAAKSYRPALNTALVINVKTAKRLGLRIDPALLNRAVEVYK